MKIVNIKGYPNHTYVEGEGYYIDFSMKSSNFSNRTSLVKSFNNKHKIDIRYSNKSNIKRTVIDQKYDQFFRESNKYTIEPFIDKKVNYKEVKLNAEPFYKTIGQVDGNDLFLELDSREFQDYNNLDLKSFVMLSEEDIMNYVYPIRFNKSIFHRKGGIISAFDVLKRLQLTSSAVDFIKGCKGFSIKHGQNAIGENNVLKSHYTTLDSEDVSFEDGLLEGYVYNENSKKVIDDINVFYDPITKQSNTSYTFKNINKISQEPRYTKIGQQKIDPFKEYDNNKNNPYVVNDSQIYLNKLRDIELNNILLNNSSMFYKIEEQKIYTNNGKTFDRSISCGIESLVFHEGLD